ncbi:DUF1648 domain-containing protein [Clostridium sp. LP20]|uniref:DUF1648 domain-containing protein n=1 Tax=Clostridium sp. LP20 TaxID=3418665 RepID=UPI003EE5B318
MSNNKPKIKIETTNLHKLLDIVSLILVGVTLVYTVMKYSVLPEIIPIHFDLAGKFSGNGAGKNGIFIFILIGVILYLGLFLLSKFPEKYMYKVEITEKNARRQYSLVKTYMKVVSLLIVTLVCYMQYSVINAIIQGKDTVGMSYMIFGGLIVISAIAYTVRSKQIK